MKRVLLIEDDQIIRENTAEILELAGYKVVTAPNGEVGSALALEIIPDLIICDIMMPIRDGYEVLHLLSVNPKTATIPFIFLTAKAEKNEIRKGMELGADDYLTKPFEDIELLKAVDSRLKKSLIYKKEFSRNIDELSSFVQKANDLVGLQTLSRDRSVARYKKKEIIFHAGDQAHYLFFLSSGSVKTYRIHDDGKELITNIFKAGDFFGHTTLFEETPYPDSASALAESEIYKIPKVDFLSLVYKNRDVAGKFIRMLSNQVAEQEQQLLRLAYGNVRKRTADAVLQLMKSLTIKGPVNVIKITRDDLARIVGTATETVIRCLAEFKEQGLIEINGREISILDVDGLKSIL
jgi:CRP-like cAMP-binding protein/CheY-like chemotaxis protein